MKSSAQVLYLYGITQTTPKNPLAIMGVDLRSAVEPAECEGVVCWISRVSAQEFERDLNKNMENLDWLATASVAHQRALAAVARETEVLPARFGTVFRNMASLRKHVRACLPQFKKDFTRLRGADEWGVKVFAVSSAVVSRSTDVASGRDYLRAKAALMPRRGSKREIDDELQRFARELDSIAEATAAAGKISSGQRGLAFQTSLLVKSVNRGRMESVLKKFSERWADSRKIECTGPWPPYSFVSAKAESADLR